MKALNLKGSIVKLADEPSLTYGLSLLIATILNEDHRNFQHQILSHCSTLCWYHRYSRSGSWCDGLPQAKECQANLMITELACLSLEPKNPS